MDEEDQGATAGDPEDGWREEEGSPRGWISPDDRLWRHPSESSSPVAGTSATASGAARTHAQLRTGTWIVGGAATCIVIALVAAGLVMVTSDSTDQGGTTDAPRMASLVGAPTTDPGLGQMAGSTAMAAMMASIRPSTVALRIKGLKGTSDTTGLVAESGGIIVTPSQALSGEESITAVESDGSSHAAQLIGLDQTSGLAVVRIDDDLPVANFDDADPAIGSVAIAAALKPGAQPGSAPLSVVYAGDVVSTGQALAANAVTTAFSSTAVRAPLARGDLGCPLLDSDGRVSGVLAMTEGSGTSTMAVFLPAELVEGVALQLVASGTVEHGWMGIQTSDADPTSTMSDGAVVTATTSTDGARVDSIEPGSPAAAAGLVPGDVITGIDGYQVDSSAELRARVYSDPPGTTLTVALERGGASLTASVVLADPVADAPGDGSSP